MSKSQQKKALAKHRILKEQEMKNKIKKAYDRGEEIFLEWKAFNVFQRNGLDLKLRFFKSKDLSPEISQWMFLVTKKNMKKIYEETIGWNDSDKKKEFKESEALFIVAFEQSETQKEEWKTPVAFVHFRFEIELEKLCLYCWEIQVIEKVQRKGLGKFLMQIIELIARKNEMDWLLLTCQISSI